MRNLKNLFSFNNLLRLLIIAVVLHTGYGYVFYPLEVPANSIRGMGVLYVVAWLLYLYKNNIFSIKK